ncbi:hypothetical protein BCR32DRAFT_243838 [Anaeromyces robustus]|uniref:Uncharacterized protein n=1 Tax=Anaeromyces robustus TaxID=1754192 RepID=A0A1Y1XAX2_9FUNG|nr:hypothetical protein BCR32DRAFT_243838 [Anaeromyces robustus]|eukprot:ORX82888.1 hypothetical protein BCR32DRAFT_243838 [Anaeromyces robustus]
MEKNKTRDGEEETSTPISFGTFEVNVKPVIEFGGITISSEFIPFYNFTNDSDSVSPPSNGWLLWIVDDDNDYYTINIYFNGGSGGSFGSNSNKYYYKRDTSNTGEGVWLTDKNNNKLIYLRDSGVDNNTTSIRFARSNFNFDFQYNNNS